MLIAALLFGAAVAVSSQPLELQRTFSLPEDAPLNTLIGYLQESPPSKGEESYLIVFPPETEVEETLLVDARSGEIRTRTRLDYERRRELVFLAIPVDGSAGIRVTISILDANDHSPVFPVQSLELQLSEYARMGSEVPLPSATDADAGTLSVQVYRIVSGNVNNAFRLSTKRLSGTLYLDLVVNAELDREFRSGYQLVIEALDGGQPARTATLAVSVAVVDANDNPPQFAQPRYLAQLMENATVGQRVIQVEASDADEGANARIEYRLAPSPAGADAYFNIESETGLLTLRRPLTSQARPQQLELLVVARDQGSQPLESTAFVSVSVLSPSQYLPHISVLFLGPDGAATVSEAAKPGDFVARLSVRDPETQEEYRRPVNLSLEGPRGPFTLSRTKEAVYLLTVAAPLDREIVAEHRLDLMAKDASGRVGRRSLDITIGDVNDSPPIFAQSEYESEVEERAGVGASVLQVTATDADAGENGTVRYSLESPHTGWFAIDSVTGLITTQAGIDCEVSSSPILRVMAEDGGDPALKSTATIRLRILDVNDNPPVFTRSVYNVSLGEDTEVGSCFLKVEATDPDCGVNAAVRYALEESALSLLSLREDSGTLCLEAPLDAETKTSIQVQVFATDGGGLSSSALIRMLVEDRDDNAPVFYPSTYNVSLASDAPVGSPLLLLSATDKDSGPFAQLQYQLQPSPHSASFRLDADRGELYLASPLNPGAYALSVGVGDGGGLSALRPAAVHVHVLSPEALANAPLWTQKLYRFTVREDTLPGIAVGSVEAVGPAGIRYSIYSGDPEGYFAVDADSGALTVAKYLDADTTRSLLLNLEAAAGNPPVFNHTQVRVEISDVNDNGPVWERSVLGTAVSEAQSTEVPFYVVEATDADRGANGEIKYRILESQPPGPFLVRPLTGELFVVSPLDYEEHKAYTLTLSATDSGLPPRSAKLTLNVEVTDANDHAPAFGQLVFDASVAEDAAPLNRIARLTATDADSGHNAHISYFLGPPHDLDGVFGVMGDSGWVYVRGALDRETKAEYNLEVIARDNGNPALSASARLRVAVLDTNDNAPSCPPSIEEAGIVSEDAGPRSFVGRLKASDPDAGANASLSYTLLSHDHLFSLDKDGRLYTRGPLDAEARSGYELSVRVEDGGEPPRSTLCAYTVRVADVNDNAPFFVLPHQSLIRIREEVPLGTELAQVRATDPDAGPNGTITYALASQSSLFRIHPRNGVITLTGRLDFEALNSPTIQLEIIARDQGTPSQSSRKQLEVEVLDIADSETASGGAYDVRFQVAETSPVGTRVGALDGERAARFNDLDQATLDDASLDLLFEISGGNTQELFDIDRVSSVIYLVKPLDYETSPLHVLSVTRVDQSRAGLPVLTEGRVEIAVSDANDNSPVWPEDPVITSLPEDAPVGHLVWKFSAEDADAGANGRLVYSIVEQSPNAAFSIDAVTGELRVDSTLDYERQTEYLLVVQAEDQALIATDRRRSRVTARVYLTDLNDNAPRFLSRERLDVFEDEPAGQPLIHVLASDPDWQDNGRVTYAILEGNEHNIFVLNETSGALSLGRRLDRSAARRKITLRLQAQDGGKPPLTASQLLDVYVQDVRSSGPRFGKALYEAMVPENSPPESPVVVVKASYQDQPAQDANNLVYSLPAGLKPSHFKIDARSGQISTTSILDREVKSTYTFTVYVGSASSSSSYDAASVLVSVGDVNDGRPRLGSGACAPVSLPENTPLPAFHTVRAADPDAGENARLRYAIVAGNAGQLFAIDEESGELSVGRLDRESAEAYQLQLRVEDSGEPPLSDTCQMDIHVLDLNDEAPIFGESEYTAEVAEDFPVGGTVLSVSAVDGDADGPNSRISYSLKDHSSALFLIHPESGAIQTLGPLDAETRSLYAFTVVARDAGAPSPLESEARITISVTDLNDHSPVFAALPFTANISSHTPSGQRVLRVAATDRDGPGANSRITYRFLKNQEDFSINPTTGVVSARRDVRLQSGTIRYLEVEAADGGGRASLGMLEIRVGGAPVSPDALRFPQTEYAASVPEDAEEGSVVGSCRADGEGGKNYRIVGGDPQAMFAVDSEGVVTLAKPGLLDREAEPVHRLVLECSSDGHHAYTALLVDVQDANDHAPRFLQPRYASAVWEGRPPGTFVLQVSAVDRDSGENAHITYSIVSGNQDSAFVVDETGRVSTGLELDREIKDRYQLSLLATDAGDPPLSSTTLLEIQVVDVNDNRPSFPPAKSVTVSENTAVGTQLAIISANDVDQASVLVYSFRQGGNAGGLFAIDPFTGGLSLAKPLDYETGDRHVLEVQVSDELHTATTPVEVVVTDENDNDPIFSKPFYQVSLPEDTPRGASILQLAASDADSADAGRLRYRLAGHVPTDSEGTAGFYLHPATGALHVNLSLARLAGARLQLGVAVEDGGTPPRADFAAVHVAVLSRPLRGQQPRFAHPDYRFQVAEDTPPHTPVGEPLTVLHPDHFPEGLVFSIISGNSERRFRIDSSGQLILARHLDRETQDEYQLRLSVYSKVNSVANSTTTVTVSVDDVNDCAPVFGRKEATAALGESAPIGATLITVSASDEDAGDNGLISYEITSGNEHGLFIMNEDTGHISVAKDLEEGTYRLIIKARDGGDPPRSAIATILASVRGENNNGPFFPIPLMLGRINENAEPGTTVFTAKATDRDGSDYTKLKYSLRDSPGPGHGSSIGLFSINEESGKVETLVPFDYEEKTTYYFLVEAEDAGGRRASVPGQVLIRGLDEFAPVFGQPAYSFNVPYDAPLDHKVGVIYATDADAGLDGIISYSFEKPSDYFTINAATGVISVTQDLLPLSKESPLGLKNSNVQRKRRAVVTTSDSTGQNEYREPEMEPLVQDMFFRVVAESGSGGGQRNVTDVHLTLGHFSEESWRTSVLDSRSITIISVVLILLLVLILLFVGLRLRRSKESKPPSPRAGAKTARPFASQDEALHAGLVATTRRHHSGPRTPTGPYSRPPAVKVSAYAGGDALYGLPPPLIVRGEKEASSSTFHPRPTAGSALPNGQEHSGSSISKGGGGSSGRGSAIPDDDPSPRFSARHNRSEQVRSIPDSGIHVFQDDNASVASDLPSAQDYLTSLGVTAPFSDHRNDLQSRIDYAESQTDDGVDVQELIYSKVSEVLGEDGGGHHGPRHVLASRTRPARPSAFGPPAPGIPGPSYQPLTHVFSEIAKLQGEQEDGLRLGQAANEAISPAGVFVPRFASPEEERSGFPSHPHTALPPATSRPLSKASAQVRPYPQPASSFPALPRPRKSGRDSRPIPTPPSHPPLLDHYPKPPLKNRRGKSGSDNHLTPKLRNHGSEGHGLLPKAA